ncbi:MAG: PIN domain-containing protein [Deltaproteobacteria bacterium]|nr:PIN domain-containing protein [Deltaproteobacteria bacterium]
MRPNSLADTGALLGLLDRNDRWHAACVDAFGSLRPPLLTSDAVLTELFHLVGDRAKDVESTWRLVRSGALELGRITTDDWDELERLMRQYQDRPMDYADATLVLLARREKITTIFTVDHDDFETYRIEGKRRFRIVPSRS